MPLLSLLFPQDQQLIMSFPARAHCEEVGSLRRRGLASIDALHYALDYHNCTQFQSALWQWKYKRIRRWDEPMCRCITAAVECLDTRSIFCPVPLHWTRRYSRGFNQSVILVDALTRASGGVVQHHLRRIRPTGFQSHRGRVERMSELLGAFCFVGDNVPLSVVLVDDLSTTGATLDACATTLKLAGVQRVEGVVLAKA